MARQEKTKEPRGIRNNNPLNIRISENAWKHKKNPSTDRQFEQFDAIIWGIRAAIKIIKTYLSSKYKCKTVADIISRFAPSSENNTSDYVRFVCKEAHISPTEKVEFWRKTQITRLVWAMAWYENGKKLDYDQFAEAYDLV